MNKCCFLIGLALGLSISELCNVKREKKLVNHEIPRVNDSLKLYFG